MKLWPQALGDVAKHLQIVDPHEPVLIGGPTIDSTEQVRIGRVISSILNLFYRVTTPSAEENIALCARKLGFDSASADLMQLFGASISPDVLARGDLLRTKSGRWQLLELNIGSSVGGMFYASLPRLSGVWQEWDALHSWATMLVDKEIGEQIQTIAFVEDPSAIDHFRQQIRTLASEVARVSGHRCMIVGADELRWDGSALKHGAALINVVYRFFNERDVLRNPSIYAPLLKAHQSGQTKFPMGLQYNLLNNKATLAYLWQLLDAGQLTLEDRKLVREWIPETRLLNRATANNAAQDSNIWVIKPISGACGINVSCGIDHSQDQWERLLEDCLQRPERFVLQRFVRPELGEVVLSGASSAHPHRLHAHIVWGIYIYGTEYLGGILRATPPGNGSVINHATGSFVGPMAPTSREQ